jgi:hypothetical protein
VEVEALRRRTSRTSKVMPFQIAGMGLFTFALSTWSCVFGSVFTYCLNRPSLENPFTSDSSSRIRRRACSTLSRELWRLAGEGFCITRIVSCLIQVLDPIKKGAMCNRYRPASITFIRERLGQQELPGDRLLRPRQLDSALAEAFDACEAARASATSPTGPEWPSR